MIQEILNFIQTNIIHFGYWVALAIFGSVIKSIAKTLCGREDTSITKKIISKFKKKPVEEPESQKEQIDNLLPPR